MTVNKVHSPTVPIDKIISTDKLIIIVGAVTTSVGIRINKVYYFIINLKG